MIIRLCWLLVSVVVSLTLPLVTLAQEVDGQYAATLTVLDEGVEILRVNTSNWIAVKVESLAGVGDTIRTDDIGRAQINFLADGNITIVQPNTTYTITRFDVSGETFNIAAEVQAGQTQHQLSPVQESSSTYSVTTPGMVLTSPGGQFAVRVESSGRSAVLTSEGSVTAIKGDARAEVPAGFGVRATVDGALSDVVPARTFAELDAALDGCTITITTLDDVSLNVRSGPGVNFEQVGYIGGGAISTVLGLNDAGNWYRIDFRGGYGWVLVSNGEVNEGCAGLRRFRDDYGPEDVSLYSSDENTPASSG